MSANWSLVCRNSTVMELSSIFYLVKCRSISKCFVQSWNIGFLAILMLLWLSHHIVVGPVSPNPNS